MRYFTPFVGKIRASFFPPYVLSSPEEVGSSPFPYSSKLVAESVIEATAELSAHGILQFPAMERCVKRRVENGGGAKTTVKAATLRSSSFSLDV